MSAEPSARPAGGHGCALLATGDLDAIVAIHRGAFPESAVTQLGPAVVERYYRWQFVGPHPHPYALGCWRDGELAGFVFGGVRYKAVAGFARGSLGTIALGALSHPRALRRLALPKVASLARLMTYRRREASPAGRTSSSRGAAPAGDVGAAEPPTEEPAGGGPSFGILSIAVRPEAQGSGVAGELMAHARAAAVDGGFAQMHLTVQVDNARAIAFYEKWGWERTAAGAGWAGTMRLPLVTG